MNDTRGRVLASFFAVFLLILISGSALGCAQAQAAGLERSESIVLGTGDWLTVSSDRQSLQLIQIRGNMSAAKFSSPTVYPANTFSLTSNSPNHYLIQLTFSYPSEYTIAVTVETVDGATQPRPSYYVSSGELLLTVDASFEKRDTITSISGLNIWDSFLNWMTRFGDAFPLWVKLLYVVLGLQFLVVGQGWIGFENTRREEDSLLMKFDRGNLLYLWSEVSFKFLLTVFFIIGVAMGGQLALLLVLNFMFLAPVTMLSLWDLFVLGFAAGITMIAYACKLILEKALDFKPLFQD